MDSPRDEGGNQANSANQWRIERETGCPSFEATLAKNVFLLHSGGLGFIKGGTMVVLPEHLREIYGKSCSLLLLRIYYFEVHTHTMFTRMSKVLGPKGNYLALCRKIGMVPFPVSVPIFDKVATIPEVLNIHDNFAAGELRDSQIENILSEAVNPVVVDCGVNVGVTVRWWFHLNPQCRVFGLDMMEEAHDLTRERLKGRNVAYVGITAALSSVDGEPITIRFDDALEGTNRIDNVEGGVTSRTLVTARIDSLLASYSLSRVELLKVDIEGYAAKALKGAHKLLSITRNVLLETHSEEELGESEAILVESGFRLRHFRNRNLWFKRA